MLRKEENLSIRKFAAMIGISKDYLVDIEKARKSPTLDTLVKVARGLDISLSELLEGIESDSDRPGKQAQTTLYHVSPM